MLDPGDARVEDGPSLDPTLCWRLPAGAELLWQTWDSETIVYNSLSGQTHLLDALSAATLKEIERDPGTIAELTRRLAERFQIGTGDLPQRLAVVCAQFDELGLAEPHAP